MGDNYVGVGESHVGWWWLEDARDDVLTGVATTNPGGTISVKILGHFSSDTVSTIVANRRAGTPYRILGVTEAGTRFSLYSPLHQKLLHGKAGMPGTSIHAECWAMGDDTPPALDQLLEARIYIGNLTKWAQACVNWVDSENHGQEVASIDVGVDRRTYNIALVGDSRDPFHLNRQDDDNGFYFRIRAQDRIAIEDALWICHRLCDFVTFATTSPTPIEQIVVNPGPPGRLPNPIRNEGTLLFNGSLQERYQSIPQEKITTDAFRVETAHELDSIVGHWVELYSENSALFDTYCSTIRYARDTVETTFLRHMRGVEGHYHRTQQIPPHICVSDLEDWISTKFRPEIESYFSEKKFKRFRNHLLRLVENSEKPGLPGVLHQLFRSHSAEVEELRHTLENNPETEEQYPSSMTEGAFRDKMVNRLVATRNCISHGSVPDSKVIPTASHEFQAANHMLGACHRKLIVDFVSQPKEG